MKLKLDEKGVVVLQDGMPVYVHDDGKEVPFDAPKAVEKIKVLSDDRDDWRTKATTYEGELGGFKALGVPAEDAAKALSTVKALDSGKLKTAEDWDRAKSEIAQGYKDQIDKITGERETIKADLEGKLRNERLSRIFDGSEFLREKTHLIPDTARALFGESWREVEGKLVPHGQDGKPLFSRKQPGEFAGHEEALELLVTTHTQADRLLRGTPANGSGATTTGRSTTTGYVINEADAKDPHKYRAAKEAAQKAGQELQIAN
jgi:hypothetical protein